MNLTAESEALAREKFEKLHPAHRKPGTDYTHGVEAIPSPTTEHLMMQCGCGYMMRYTRAQLLAQPIKSRYPEGPPPFRSLTSEFKRGGSK